MELLEQDDIIDWSYGSYIPSWVSNSGIYFLINNWWWEPYISYVGKSTNLSKRLWQHRCINWVWYDAWNYIECDKDHLNYWEWLYIIKFNPMYNIMYNPKSEFISRKVLIKKYWYDKIISEWLKYTEKKISYMGKELYSESWLLKMIYKNQITKLC